MRRTLLAVVGALASVSAAPAAAVADATAAAVPDLGCSAATIRGAYALSVTGFQGTAPNFVPVAVARIAHFDGVRRFRGDGYASVGGQPQRFSSTGTYRVARDCTVTMDGMITVGDGTNRQYGVIADDGNRIVTTRTDPGQTVVLTYERIRRR
jgi:hypothetical protein